MTIAMLGVDLGKNSVSVVGLDDRGAVVLRRYVTRESLMALLTKLPPSKVAMEACGGGHYIGRAAQALATRCV
jgi:transposase